MDCGLGGAAVCGGEGVTEPIYLTTEQFYAGSTARKITLWRGGPPQTNPATGHVVAGGWRIIDWTFAEPEHCPPEWRSGTRCWRVDLTETSMEAVQYVGRG